MRELYIIMEYNGPTKKKQKNKVFFGFLNFTMEQQKTVTINRHKTYCGHCWLCGKYCL